MDVPSRILTKAEEKCLTEGFIVGRDRTIVPLSQFEDDTIFFSKASQKILQNLKLILLAFGQLSSFKINLEKIIFFGVNVSQELLSKLAMMLDCRVLE